MRIPHSPKFQGAYVTLKRQSPSHPYYLREISLMDSQQNASPGLNIFFIDQDAGTWDLRVQYTAKPLDELSQKLTEARNHPLQIADVAQQVPTAVTQALQEAGPIHAITAYKPEPLNQIIHKIQEGLQLALNSLQAPRTLETSTEMYEVSKTYQDMTRKERRLRHFKTYKNMYKDKSHAVVLTPRQLETPNA